MQAQINMLLLCCWKYWPQIYVLTEKHVFAMVAESSLVHAFDFKPVAPVIADIKKLETKGIEVLIGGYRKR